MSDLAKVLAAIEHLETGQKHLQDGQKQLENGQTQLQNGQKQLETGQMRLETGLIQLQTDVAVMKGEVAKIPTLELNIEAFRAEQHQANEELLSQIIKSYDDNADEHEVLEKRVDALKNTSTSRLGNKELSGVAFIRIFR